MVTKLLYFLFQTEIMTILTEILEELYGPIAKGTQSNTRSESSLTSLNGLHQADNGVERKLDKENQNTVEKTHYTCIKEPAHSKIDNENHSEFVQGSDECAFEQIEDNISSADSLTGLRISFYDSDKTGSGKTADLQTGTSTELDSNKNVIKDKNSDVNVNGGNRDGIGIEMDCDLVLTQGAKGNFDLLDDDLDYSLISQTGEKFDSDLDNTEMEGKKDPVVQTAESTEKSGIERTSLVNLNALNEEVTVINKDNLQIETETLIRWALDDNLRIIF